MLILLNILETLMFSLNREMAAVWWGATSVFFTTSLFSQSRHVYVPGLNCVSEIIWFLPLLQPRLLLCLNHLGVVFFPLRAVSREWWRRFLKYGISDLVNYIDLLSGLGFFFSPHLIFDTFIFVLQFLNIFHHQIILEVTWNNFFMLQNFHLLLSCDCAFFASSLQHILDVPALTYYFSFLTRPLLTFITADLNSS